MTSVAMWRDIALVFLILQAFILALIPAAALYFMNKGLRQGIRWLKKRGVPEAQRYSRLVADKSQNISTQILSPTIAVDAQLTRVKQTPAALLHVLKRRQRRSHV